MLDGIWKLVQDQNMQNALTQTNLAGGYASKRCDVRTDTGKLFKACIVLPNTTENQAEAVAYKLNLHIQSKCAIGIRYRVLDVYPHCGVKRIALCGR